MYLWVRLTALMRHVGKDIKSRLYELQLRLVNVTWQKHIYIIKQIFYIWFEVHFPITIGKVSKNFTSSHFDISIETVNFNYCLLHIQYIFLISSLKHRKHLFKLLNKINDILQILLNALKIFSNKNSSHK